MYSNHVSLRAVTTAITLFLLVLPAVAWAQNAQQVSNPAATPVTATPVASAQPAPAAAPSADPSDSAAQRNAADPDPKSDGSAPDAAAAAGIGDPANGTHTLPGTKPLPSLLGMTLEEAYDAFGAPDDVFPVRGDAAWEDDVVFYFSDHTYLFWYQNRVWQVRADSRYTASFIGVTMGESQSDVEQALGGPLADVGNSEVFVLPGAGFPIRARLFFDNGKLSDAYIYRGDF